MQFVSSIFGYASRKLVRAVRPFPPGLDRAGLSVSHSSAGLGRCLDVSIKSTIGFFLECSVGFMSAMAVTDSSLHLNWPALSRTSWALLLIHSPSVFSRKRIC